MLNKFFQNTRKPVGKMGRLMLRSMNTGHASLSKWALSFLRLADYPHILDVGCGGGANIAKMLNDSPQSIVDGIDYSEESVAVSRKNNRDAIAGKRCTIQQGDVAKLPYADASIDLVTAFETVYFWPLEEGFAEVHRVLKEGGVFLISCEFDDADDTTWTKRIEGMTIYRADDLEERLNRAGFRNVEINRRGKWICLKAVC